jgi:ATP-dependent Clp protease ATP-binding subunit ClpA
VQYSSGIAENFWKKIDQKSIVNAPDFLASRVFGQKYAIKRVCNLLNQAYLGLSYSQFRRIFQNQGFFLLAGHECVGKTTLAYAVKDLLLGPYRDMILLNMGDYQDENAWKRLMSITLDNGSFLGKIKKNPYSVILFENIESAQSVCFKTHLPSSVTGDTDR